MGIPTGEGAEAIHHARHRTELAHGARMIGNGKSVAVVAAAHGRGQRGTQILLQGDKGAYAPHLFLLIHLAVAVLHERKNALVFYAHTVGQALVGELAAVIALEVHVKAGHKARPSPSELVLGA